MDDASLEELTCALARRLYRIDAKGLEQAELRLLRLLELLRHYRRCQRHPGDPGVTGAAHLCQSGGTDTDPHAN